MGLDIDGDRSFIADAVALSAAPDPSTERQRNAAGATSAAARPGSLTLGRLVALHGDAAWVRFTIAGRQKTLAAQSLLRVTPTQVGVYVGLMFEDGDVDRPIIVGMLEHAAPDAPRSAVHFEADCDVVTVCAAERLVLRCGKASITLTAAGKILIDGEYVSSKAAGLNRIRGGAIHLN